MKETIRASAIFISLLVVGCNQKADEVKRGVESADQRAKVMLKTDLRPASFDPDTVGSNDPEQSFLVPEGVRLLSRGVKVTSSDDDSLIIGGLAMITDGNAVEGAHGYEVEIGGGEWVQLDLGSSYSLCAILVWHYYYPSTPDGTGALETICHRVYQDVIVQVSDDPHFANNVQTVFNSDQDGSLGIGSGKDDTYTETTKGLWINTGDKQGRYVRLYNSGYVLKCAGLFPSEASENFIGLSNYIEVEVYGE